MRFIGRRLQMAPSDCNHLLHTMPCGIIGGGWGCEVSCGGHHRPKGKTTTGSALDGAVFGIAQILAYLPASKGMLDRRWANVVTYVGATSANDVGPTWICPSVQRRHNVVTPPTMTLCRRFANVITYCILLNLMVGITFAHRLSLLTCLTWARTGPMPVASTQF